MPLTPSSPSPPPALSPPPQISVIIPAYNEQDYLPRLLESIDAARNQFRDGPEAIEVIVANNQSTDATEAIAQQHGCLVTRVEQRVIAAARNGGASLASGAILCFVDADTVIHPQSFNAIDNRINAQGYVGGATGWVLERYSLGLHITRALVFVMTRLAAVDAGMVFCRADVFRALGGYDERRKFAEDVAFFRAMRRYGKNRGMRTALTTRSPAIFSTRKFDTHGDWHMFRMLLWIPARYGSFKNLVNAYWYDERERF